MMSLRPFSFYVATGASVHRRGRCIGVSLTLPNGTTLFLVLVCLSVDVTGALALPNSFWFDCLHVLHAPPPICPFSHLAVLRSGVSCLSSAVVPGGICVFLLSLAPRARRSVLSAPLVSGAGFGVSALPALPFCFLSRFVLPSQPRG